MFFSSLFFLCVFLPINLFFYYLIDNIRYKNIMLIISSLVFYAWGEPVWILILVSNAIFNYFIGISAEKNRKERKGKAIVVFGIIANLSILVFFKYLGFFVESFNLILGSNIPIIDISVPIGISFYTFKTISYILDVYRGDVKRRILRLGSCYMFPYFTTLSQVPSKGISILGCT